MQLKIHEVYITAGLGLELGKLKFIKNKVNFLKKLQFVKIDDQNAKSVSKSVPNSIPNSVVSLSLKKTRNLPELRVRLKNICQTVRADLCNVLGNQTSKENVETQLATSGFI